MAYCAPYIFAFSPTIIEVRDAFTGRLAQFITGSQIALTYDGAGVAGPTSDARLPRAYGATAGAPEVAPEKRIHFSMKIGNYHVLYEVAIINPGSPVAHSPHVHTPTSF